MVIRSRPQSLHDIFIAYAEDCAGYSPLYEHITRAIAGDAEVQALAAGGLPGQPAPNLICAATHYLLLAGVQHDLARYYPSVTANAASIDEALYPAFRDFCQRNAEAIRALVASRLVQTNEVGRSACLLPGYAEVARREGGRPLALIDFGCSAGLNLLFDRFGYDYGALHWGTTSSPVQLRCELRGAGAPSFDAGSPVAGWRVGVDLNPIDVTDDDALLWLRALVWPEHREREATLVAAAGLMRRHPQRLLRGDGVALLPQLIAEAPPEHALVVYYSFVLHQLSPEARRRFYTVLGEASRARPIYVVSMAGLMQATKLELTTWRDGHYKRETLGECMAHGQWLRWSGVDRADASP
jgi:hypothetical protein